MTHLRLLHVDDDPDFLDLSARVFEGFGDRYAVETVDDAGAALDRLARGGVDCLVSDSLRTATGEAFVVAARRAAADLPIVFCTGSEWDAVATDADAAGTAGYVRKGRGDFARLRETVDAVVGDATPASTADGWVVVGRHDWNADDELVVTLASTAATLEDVDVEELASLSRTVDVEALEDLLRSATVDVAATFHLEDDEVAVRTDGTVAVRPAA